MNPWRILAESEINIKYLTLILLGWESGPHPHPICTQLDSATLQNNPCFIDPYKNVNAKHGPLIWDEENNNVKLGHFLHYYVQLKISLVAITDWVLLPHQYRTKAKMQTLIIRKYAIHPQNIIEHTYLRLTLHGSKQIFNRRIIGIYSWELSDHKHNHKWESRKHKYIILGCVLIESWKRLIENTIQILWEVEKREVIFWDVYIIFSVFSRNPILGGWIRKTFPWKTRKRRRTSH